MGVDGQVRNRAIFLDRDGVLNHAIVREGKPYPPSSIDEFIIFPGLAERLARIKEKGFFLIVVTNQPDVARGKITHKIVNAFNRLLREQLPIDHVLVCFHDDSDKCDCRKPLPGLLHQAQERFNLDLDHSYMVGDRWRDIGAGTAAGCTTVFVDYGYNEEFKSKKADYSCQSPSDALDWILTKESH